MKTPTNPIRELLFNVLKDMEADLVGRKEARKEKMESEEKVRKVNKKDVVEIKAIIPACLGEEEKVVTGTALIVLGVGEEGMNQVVIGQFGMNDMLNAIELLDKTKNQLIEQMVSATIRGL